jgi:hypothetical protein
MHAAGPALLPIDSASGWTGYVIGPSPVAVGLAIVRDDLAFWWRVLQQGRDSRRAGPVVEDPVAADAGTSLGSKGALTAA